MPSRGHYRRRAAAKKTLAAPVSIPEYDAKSEQFQDTWNRITHVVSKMRSDDVSLPQASREFGVDSRTVVRSARSALKRLSNGRYAAKPTDNLLRVLVMPTSDGLREIGVRDSREASLIGKYWAAVQKYLETGDATALRRLRRKQITDASGASVPLIKDLAELDRLGSAGVLSFESLYAKSA
jgi:hypothetical protein